MKTTKWIAATLMAVALVGITLAASGCKSACCAADKPAAKTSAMQYTCAMHPEVTQSTPGNCPKCGMALTEKQ